MKIEDLLTALDVPFRPGSEKMELYDAGRSFAFDKFFQKYQGQYQSPSIQPTTHSQRSEWQNVKEHSVYQRSDYTPSNTEALLNSFYKPISGKQPRTLLFNSGMGAISTLLFFLNNTLKTKRMLVGRNCYFETKWLFDDSGNCQYWNEYLPLPKTSASAVWIEYPINCTTPHRYPFSQSSQDKHVVRAVKYLCQKANKRPNQEFFLVIDYTLFYLPLETHLFDELPENVSLFLITSLQKHRTYGFDLFNGGAITFFTKSEEREEKLKLLRGSLGTNFTQEASWIHFPFQSQVINKLITDSGKNAQNVFRKLPKFDGITYFFADNDTFLSSFIFAKIEPSIMKRYKNGTFYSEQLIAAIIKAASKQNTVIIQGTSFGFPFTRIFKNSERYENTNSLRLAIGFDEEMNESVAQAIIEGTQSFLNQIRKEK